MVIFKTRIRVAAVALMVVGLFFFGAPASAAEIPFRSELSGMEPSRARELDAYVKIIMEELRSPGMIVGVVQGETLTYAGYFGWADLATGRLVDEDTIFRVGSISKSMAAIGLFRQWERGQFQLDDDVNRYLPEPLIFPPNPETNPVTFRHLLTHTSGGGEFLSYAQVLLPGQGIQVQGEDYQPLYEYLKLGMKTRVDPGLVYAYSNYGYGFLGLALESMAEKPFNDYMIEHVFKPLGMDSTTFHHDREMLKKMAVGYKVDKDGEFRDTPHRAGGITPAGNAYTTLREFSLYAIALLNGGANRHGRVIKPETLEMMMQTQFSVDSRQGGYGFAFRSYGDRVWGGYRVIGHSGSVPFGYTAMMLLVPDQRVAVIICSSSGTRTPTEAAWGVLRRTLRAHEPRFTPAGKSPEVWDELVGTYGPIHRHFKINTRLYMGGIGNYQVEEIDGELMLIHTWRGKKNARKLYQVNADDPYFYRLERRGHSDAPPNYVAFERGEDGRIYIMPSAYDRYVKLEGAELVKARLLEPTGRIVAELNPF